MSYIHAIGTATPSHVIEQKDAAAWMADALSLRENDRKRINALYAASGIESRYSVIADYEQKLGHFKFFPNRVGLEPFPTVSKRMELYRHHAPILASEACRQAMGKASVAPRDITHLIVVSCTGMYAPGLDMDLIEELGLNTCIERTLIQFMGCYAAFNGLKAANYICRAEPQSCVLLVCVELCTLHFQKNTGRDALVSNALFGDGAAAAVVKAIPSKNISLRMTAFHSDIASEGKEQMAWQISEHGFEMTLAAHIPKTISRHIGGLTAKVLEKMNRTKDDIAHYAIHPGGWRILKAIEKALNLPLGANVHAYNILRRYGNMSSPTILFVLDSLLSTFSSEQAGESVLAIAFGPGLTLESMLLECKV